MELKNLILETLDEVIKDDQEQEQKEEQRQNLGQDQVIQEGIQEIVVEESQVIQKTPKSKELQEINIKSHTEVVAYPNISHDTNTKLLSLTKKIESSPIKTGKVLTPSKKIVFDPDNVEFVENLREKLLILFEGLQVAEIKDLEKKVSLVVNFLQYELCLLDEFLEKKNSN